MATVRRPSRRKPPEKPARGLSQRHRLAVLMFCILVVVGPLAFGAVDRLTQIGLLAVFAAGLYARPAVVLPLTRWGNRLAIGFLVLVLVKEFAPAAWFGTTHWRSLLEGNLGLDLPWTHQPEPARALDALLSLTAAALWFAWVRTLASDREMRPVLAWTLVASGAVLTAVAYTTRGLDPHAIYGMRFTPGWTGFGPFPNRNHTGDLLAVALVLGCGCTIWSAVRKERSAAIAGGLLCLIIFAGLLGSQSRGALIAAVAGMGACVLLIALKLRSRRVLAIGAAVGVLILAFAILGGAQVFSRFQSHEAGGVSNSMRVQIWQDALRMWWDAPLFGHGVGTFAQIVGPYQTLRLEDGIVLHPESSWLQVLVEFGLLPAALGAVGLVLFVGGNVRAAFERERGFYLRAGAIAAFAVLVVHAAIDVPAHRWGTLAFALAALALGCPLRVPGRLPTGTVRTALVPAAIAVFWALPLICDWPAWAPLSVARLEVREQATNAVPLEELEAAANIYPLDARLHQSLGMRQVRILGRAKPTVWQRHFSIASTLVPASWSLLAMQARTVAGVTPGLSIAYWQQAVERCDLHREEVLGIGVRETLSFPAAPVLWSHYVEANPSLLLPYAREIPSDQARYFYSIWWQTRALTAQLTPAELQIYYQYAARWGTRSQFDEWMRDRAAWKARDFRQWASLLHQWNDDKRSFEMLAEHVPEPEFPPNPSRASRESMESKWRDAPKDVVNAQFLAFARRLAGETVQSDELILEVAQKDYAPPWFLKKAGYIYARQGRYGEGVGLVLRAVK